MLLVINNMIKDTDTYTIYKLILRNNGRMNPIMGTHPHWFGPLRNYIKISDTDTLLKVYLSNIDEGEYVR